MADTALPALIEKHQQSLLDQWVECQRRAGAFAAGRAAEDELTVLSRRFISEVRRAAADGSINDISAPEWRGVREVLEDVSQRRALAAFSPSETAAFVFSLKEPLFDLLRRELGGDAAALGRECWIATRLFDRLGLFMIELYQKLREEVIARQQQELLELSTPVVLLADGILALPLIGTLDSERTQVVMESLLEEIVRAGAEIAIIDITGVPTVDTLVAQHHIKTVSAARLMGADCIISGIRPQIAQTIVHLGLDLDVVSKATMASAFALALRRTGRAIVARQAPRETGNG